MRHNITLLATRGELRPTFQCLVRASSISRVNRYLMHSTLALRVSDGHDAELVERETKGLMSRGWQLTDDQVELRKIYYLKTYTKALDLVSQIGIRSKSKNHHPVLILRSGSVEVHWTTHHPRGLSAKDTFMARYCDDRAQEIGTVQQHEAQKCGPSLS